MTTTINADTSTGGAVISGDASGVLGLQAAGSTQVTINGSGVVLANPLPVGSGGTGATSLSGITAGSATNLAGGSAGTIPYQSASGTTAMLAAGTSGQVLTSSGAGAPTWSDPAGGGSLILLQTVTGSGVSAIDVTGYFTSTYKFYKLYVSCQYSTYETPAFRLFIDGSLYTTAYYANTSQYSDAGNPLTNSYASSAFAIEPNIAGYDVDFEITFFDPSNANRRNAFHYSAASSLNGADSNNMRGWANNKLTGTAGQRAITGFRVYGSTGNYTARLYGIKES